MRKSKVKEYFYNEDGKITKIDESIESNLNDNELYNENNDVIEPNQINEDINDNQEQVIKKPVISEQYIQDVLVKNPFLFDINENVGKDDRLVNSLEDFYIKGRKEDYKIKDLFRNQLLRKGKRKKLIKQSFKNWKDEIDERLSDVELVGKNQLLKEDLKKKKEISFALTRVLCVVSLVLIGLLLNLNWLYGTKIPALPDKLVFAFNFGIPALIGIFIISGVMRRNLNKSEAINKSGKRTYLRMISSIRYEFDKKYKQTFKYYRKAVNGKFSKAQLPIEKTAVGESKFKEAEGLVNETSKRVIVQGKQEKYVRFFKNFLGFLSILTSIGIGVYTLVLVVVKLIGK